MADDRIPRLELLDQIADGPWPSFVREMKQAAEEKDSARDLMLQLERSYEDKTCHWKHGGIVGVRGYGGGVIGRYADDPEGLPGVREFHTMRINHPSGWFYTSDSLRKIADIWDRHGSGITNFHGATGDVILLGTSTQELQPCFDELSEEHFDLGGSGSALRSPSCCVGPGYCEHSCIDTLDICHVITQTFQNELHRPAWPYKFKIKVSGCPNDCVASIARSDLAIIGTWRDEIQVKEEAVREYAAGGMNIEDEIVRRCPGHALTWDNAAQELVIHNEDCVRCMHCINKMPRALKPGKVRGATLLIGGKATILRSAFLGWVLVPFMKLEPPYAELINLITKIFDWWDENAKTRERIGELIYRLGMPRMLKDLGLDPAPQMVRRPRANPYIFWSAEEVQR